ncbi:MAG: hypothetical protein U0936_22840 [Planctomycetaceae bacterium]
MATYAGRPVGGRIGPCEAQKVGPVSLGSVLLFVEVAAGQSPELTSRYTEVVATILITLDGLRWQEVFGGVDETLMDKDLGGVKDLPELKRRFQRESTTESRNALMPFFWTTLARDGVIFGDPEHESKAIVTNGLNFSYPGYSEILCGFVDPKVDSNAKKNNENVTVLEWLSQKPGFEDRIAAFCSWDVFPSSSTKLAAAFRSMPAGNRWLAILN